MGIGGLPTYALPLGAEVEPVDIGIKHQLDIWLTYHEDVRNVKRIALFIDWVRSLFDPKKYPWFRDEFIHPNDLLAPATPPPASRRSQQSVVAGPPRPVRIV